MIARQRIFPDNWYLDKKAARLLLAVFVVVTAISCVAPGAVPTQPSLAQPESPLIPGTNRILAENQWRLVEISDHGDVIEFDAIQPIYLTFHISGVLSIRTTGCNTGGFHILAERENRYQLDPGDATKKDCGEIRNKQYDQVSEAVGVTTEYEIQGNQLFLTGEDVRIVLEIDNPR